MTSATMVPKVSCWLCGTPTEIQWTKKNKPYLTCTECGVQIFVRYERAEELLAEKVRKQMDVG